MSRGDHDPAIARLQAYFDDLPWVARAELRLREHGELLLGDVFLAPREPVEADALREAARAAREAKELDWKIYELTVALETLDDRSDAS